MFRYKTIIKNCSSIEEKALKIYGLKSKKVKEFIIRSEENQNFSMIELHFILLKKGFKYDHLNFWLLLGNQLPSFFPKLINSLLKIYTHKIILRMFKETHWNIFRHDIKDIYEQLIEIEKHSDLYSKLKRINIKSLHWLDTHLSRLLLYVKKEDFNLDQKDIALKLDNKKFKFKNNEVKILTPKTKHDLINCSEMFDFCIGTSDYYGLDIKNGNSSFIAIFLDNKPYQGILFNENRIIQAWNKSNDDADFELKHFIREKIYNNKRIEADSSWISHFEYSENILTMVTKSGHKYNYNVDQFTINELENSPSRGKFYTKYIKGNFERVS